MVDEYSALRNEIVSMQERENNAYLTLYTTFAVMFVAGIEISNRILPVAFIVIIVFQCLINDYFWSVEKISTYIRLFYEPDNNAHWESMHYHIIYKEYYKRHQRSLPVQIKNRSPILLGLLTVGAQSYWYYKTSANNSTMSLADMLLLAFSVFSFALVMYLNLQYEKRHTNELESTIEQYKNNVIRNK